MYKQDAVFNNLQGMMCNKIQPLLPDPFCPRTTGLMPPQR